MAPEKISNYCIISVSKIIKGELVSLIMYDD